MSLEDENGGAAQEGAAVGCGEEGGEGIEEVERSDGAHAPVERRHEEELHAADGAGLEHVAGVEDLEIDEEWDVRLLHLGSHRQARHGEQLHRPVTGAAPFRTLPLHILPKTPPP